MPIFGPVTGSVSISEPVALLSGSVSGLLVGGVAVAGSNPVPVTGSMGLTGPITGSVGLSGPVAVSNFPATQNVSVLSGSVSGLLVGGVALSSTNPVPITGSVGITAAVTVLPHNVTDVSGSVVGLLVGGVAVAGTNPVPITGSVGITSAIAVSNFPATQNVSVLSGSVTGLLVGGQPASTTNPVPVNVSSATIVSGSLTGLLVGGVAVAGTNPLPTTGSVSIASAVAVTQGTSPWVVSGSNWIPTITGSVGLSGPITGSVGLAGPVAISNFPATQNVSALSGSVSGLLVGGVALSSANPIPASVLSGSVTGLLVGGQPASTTNPVPVNVSSATIVSGSVTGLLVGGVAVAGSNPVPVTGSVGLAGPVAVSNFPSTQNVSVLSGSVSGLLVGGVALSTANPAPVVHVSGSITGLQVGGVALSNANPVPASVLSGSVTGLLVGGQPASTTNPVPVNVSSATIVSGSVTGLLVGGVAVAGTNPVPVTGSVSIASAVAVTQGTSPWIISGSSWIPTVTGSVGLSGPITGSVGLAGPVTVSNFPATQNVSVLSGSVSGLLVGGVALSSANPIPASVLSGSVTGLLVGGQPASTTNPVPVNVSSATIVSGSVTGLLVGGVAVAGSNPVPVTGSVGITSAVAVSNFPGTQNVSVLSGSVSGLLVGGVALSSANPLPATAISGSVTGLLAGGVAVSMTNPLPITGSVYILNPGGAASNVTSVSGSVTGLLVGGVALSTANPAPVIHVSGSITGLQVGGVALSNANPVPTSVLSGSVTGLLVGGQPASSANPVPVNVSSATIVSGSVTGLLVGGVALSSANPIPEKVVSGSVTGLQVGGVDLSTANPIPAKITNGTNTATVVAASTAAATTDKALVVRLPTVQFSTNIPSTIHPIVVGGEDDNGQAQFLKISTAGYQYVIPTANQQYANFQTTITATGNTVIQNVPAGRIGIVINCPTVTGTTPKMVVTVSDVSPEDTTRATNTYTVIATVTTPGVYVGYHNTASTCVRISWTVTGTTPSFTTCSISVIGPVAVGSPSVSSTYVATYMASTPPFTPAASATDIFAISGAAGKIIKVLRITLSGTQTTAGNIGTIQLIKRSTANSGGTSASPAKIPVDSAMPVASASVLYYTANPTLGTAVGTIYAPRVLVPAPATAVSPPTILNFDVKNIMAGQPVTLNGTAESLVVNMSGTVPTGAANFQVCAFWTEE